MNLFNHTTRPRWYLPTIAGLVVMIAGLVGVATLFVNELDETVLDTVLGLVAGILFGSLLGIILFTEMGRRAAIRRRDAAALDNLEPLRNAGR